MTDQELIQTAKQAMEDLWNSNNGKLMDYEQSAYNCLRLLCEKVEEPCIPVFVTTDDSGHWYIVPQELKEDWDYLRSRLENEDDPMYYGILDQFETKFGQYRTGGDINLVQLYIKQ